MSDFKNDNIWLMKGDCLERMKEIPDGSVDMVLTDPPYIGMVNQKWDTVDDEVAEDFYNSVFSQIKKALRYGGRSLLFGSNKTLGFYYRNSTLLNREILVVEKDAKQVAAGRNTKQYKQHINCTEYVFVSTKYAREHVKSMLLDENNKLGYSSKDVNSMLGVKSNGGGMWSIYTGNNKCHQVPTQEQWLKFQQVFTNLPPYETFGEIFNNRVSMGNVIKGFNFNMKPRLHPTQKPVALMEYLIKTYTNEGETVLDFTMGSGTTGVACRNLNRKFIGIEMDENYFNIAKERILNE